jgi:probable rRNA maturation factor
MITHGVCHLVGYDHIIEDDKIKMRELEEKILSKVGVKKDI